MKNGLYIGLMSGTSIDSIDSVLVDFQPDGLKLISHFEYPWPPELKQRLRRLTLPGENEIDLMGELDSEVADHFADCTNRLIKQADIRPNNILAIGSHGQTIRHRPDIKYPFTLQIGDPNRVAEKTGITVVADFRRRDIAAGGQGAPLVPAFHADLLSNPGEQRAILNIGGIANLTLLPGKKELVCGFDTGPGNTLMDSWARRHLQRARDNDGEWAASGTVVQALLETMLADPYFEHSPPKSTGPEYFSVAWIDNVLQDYSDKSAADIQATLTALTAESVCRALKTALPECRRVIICGGGVHNGELMRQLSIRLTDTVVETTALHGLPPDQVEAIAFAWLARRTLSGVAGNLPKVTGATRPVVLGGIYPA
ncbi:MAG: anhydro-N-acetylmuramic acid kinase [Candidatus Sedimenticola sp. (ex Thyasira tokunagai)]